MGSHLCFVLHCQNLDSFKSLHYLRFRFFSPKLGHRLWTSSGFNFFLISFNLKSFSPLQNLRIQRTFCLCGLLTFTLLTCSLNTSLRFLDAWVAARGEEKHAHLINGDNVKGRTLTRHLECTEEWRACLSLLAHLRERKPVRHRPVSSLRLSVNSRASNGPPVPYRLD